jgi:hypothetical protein
LSFEFTGQRVGAVEFRRDFREQAGAGLGVGFFVRQMEVSFEVAGGARQFRVRRDALFGLLALLQGTLRFFLVLPEVGLADQGFQAGKYCAVAREVKDSSAPARCVASTLRSDVRGLRESWLHVARAFRPAFHRHATGAALKRGATSSSLVASQTGAVRH